MSSLEVIKSPIAEEMKKFEPFFRSSMKTRVPLLNIITNYIIRRKGKQMRPMFVFLSAKLNGEVNDSTYTAAALIELLHTATLVHDDVVDDSHERRGFFSVNALWKNKISVLVGDYFLSRGLLLAINNSEYELLKIVSEAVKEMSEGELLQIEGARKLNVGEEQYYKIIKKKTASLIASCSAGGAASVGSDEETVSKMKLFGEYTGIAFQIKDDIFDYRKNGIIGKPTGNDIREKKLTLPIIYVLDNMGESEKKRVIGIVRKHNKNAKKVNEVIDLVERNGGLKYAAEMMNEYKDKALKVLSEFPDNDAKTALSEMVNYTISRKK